MKKKYLFFLFSSLILFSNSQSENKKVEKNKEIKFEKKFEMSILKMENLSEEDKKIFERKKYSQNSTDFLLEVLSIKDFDCKQYTENLSSKKYITIVNNDKIYKGFISKNNFEIIGFWETSEKKNFCVFKNSEIIYKYNNSNISMIQFNLLYNNIGFSRYYSINIGENNQLYSAYLFHNNPSFIKSLIDDKITSYLLEVGEKIPKESIWTSREIEELIKQIPQKDLLEKDIFIMKNYPKITIIKNPDKKIETKKDVQIKNILIEDLKYKDFSDF